MRYNPLPKSVYINNRKRFISKMKPNTIAIFTSNDVKHTNADDVMGFAQNNDLVYLSGIDQFDTILVLYPDAYKEENREILFIKHRSELEKIWDGEVLTNEQASHLSGINRIENTDDFTVNIYF